jgi:hypothetical protein
MGKASVNKLAVDVNTIKSIKLNGVEMTAHQILQMYASDDVLVYDSTMGHKPIVISGEPELKDINKK